MSMSKIRLESTRDRDLPDGSRVRGYEFRGCGGISRVSETIFKTRAERR